MCFKLPEFKLQRLGRRLLLHAALESRGNGPASRNACRHLRTRDLQTTSTHKTTATTDESLGGMIVFAANRGKEKVKAKKTKKGLTGN